MAPIFSNRSQCHIKLESYGAALNDADKALENNPKFFKAYYRKGSAYLALGKLKEARDNYKLVFYVNFATQCLGQENRKTKR